uniref:Uncharacterized protein n=1 Tax=Ectopseudomonas oleovorans TaxID=301 RepID=A0A653BC63_ECTOL
MSLDANMLTTIIIVMAFWALFFGRV